jgi:hypothetical protein
MFKWSVQAEATAKATPRNVWDIWTDVASWPTWDHDLEWSQLHGPFKVGTEGKLKPKGWPASKFRLISVEEEKSHSDRTVMPLTEVVFKHSLAVSNGKEVRILHRVEVRGLLAPLLWMTMRLALKKGMPVAVKKLAQLAEARAKEKASV